MNPLHDTKIDKTKIARISKIIKERDFFSQTHGTTPYSNLIIVTGFEQGKVCVNLISAV